MSKKFEVGQEVTYYPESRNQSIHHRAVVTKVCEARIKIKYSTSEGPFHKLVDPATLTHQMELV